jgi:hypothetical protein
MILVGLVAVFGGNEPLARNLAHRRQDARIANASRGNLPVHHLVGSHRQKSYQLPATSFQPPATSRQLPASSFLRKPVLLMSWQLEAGSW